MKRWMRAAASEESSASVDQIARVIGNVNDIVENVSAGQQNSGYKQSYVNVGQGYPWIPVFSQVPPVFKRAPKRNPTVYLLKPFVSGIYPAGTPSGMKLAPYPDHIARSSQIPNPMSRTPLAFWTRELYRTSRSSGMEPDTMPIMKNGVNIPAPNRRTLTRAYVEPANRSVSIRMRNGAPAHGARMIASIIPSRNAPLRSLNRDNR